MMGKLLHRVFPSSTPTSKSYLYYNSPNLTIFANQIIDRCTVKWKRIPRGGFGINQPKTTNEEKTPTQQTTARLQQSQSFRRSMKPAKVTLDKEFSHGPSRRPCNPMNQRVCKHKVYHAANCRWSHMCGFLRRVVHQFIEYFLDR